MQTPLPLPLLTASITGTLRTFTAAMVVLMMGRLVGVVCPPGDSTPAPRRRRFQQQRVQKTARSGRCWHSFAVFHAAGWGCQRRAEFLCRGHPAGLMRVVRRPRVAPAWLKTWRRGKFVTAALPLAFSRQNKRPCFPLFIREAGPSHLAVTVGFEPTLALTPNNISSVAPSAARTRHQPE